MIDRRDSIKPTTYPKTGGVHEHRIVAEIVLKRRLNKYEVVHHIDENKHNNSVENLAVLPNQNVHALVHFSDYNFDEYKLLNLSKNEL
ncbi:HNH endonuclease [Joostella sp.]|uniref:HNH endonuclease n=1 Tax=Joostella sp. TaxID=2231138 RepID=UPI003A95179B